jgi:hypothetical protein
VNPKDLVGAKKAPLSLVPPSAIIAIAEAMGNGADKYGPFNWREYPVQVRTYVEAAQRHLLAFLDGQWAAEDTGISHLSHAMAGLAILYDAFTLGSIEDNRSHGMAADELRRQDKSAKASEPLDLEVALTTLRGWRERAAKAEKAAAEEKGWSIAETGQVSFAGMPLDDWRAQGVEVLPYEDDKSDVLSPLECDWYHTGVHDPWCRVIDSYTTVKAELTAISDPLLVDVENRGEWPPDTRVAGRLTCCGASEHTLDCAQYR